MTSLTPSPMSKETLEIFQPIPKVKYAASLGGLGITCGSPVNPRARAMVSSESSLTPPAGKRLSSSRHACSTSLTVGCLLSQTKAVMGGQRKTSSCSHLPIIPIVQQYIPYRDPDLSSPSMLAPAASATMTPISAPCALSSVADSTVFSAACASCGQPARACHALARTFWHPLASSSSTDCCG